MATDLKHEILNPAERVREGLKSWLLADEDSGLFKVDREVFTDPDIFDLEMKYIFERNWVYATHESQIPNPNDFVTTFIGRVPVVLTRTASGKIKCLVNVCSHRGARVCRDRTGNRKTFSCPFHGWTYSNSGELLDVTDEDSGGYPPSFDRSALGLQDVLVESYRGFVFASLSRDVVPLDEYLAGAKQFIDLLVDQSPSGQLEVIRGTTHYEYPGNWKLQVENGLDGYHVGSTHGNYIMTVTRRLTGDSQNKTIAADATRLGETGGFFSFQNGHQVTWGKFANAQQRPNYEMREWYIKEYGHDRAQWMNGRIRNLLLFPNVFLMDQISTQIRIIRPLAVDRTEVTTYCFAPVEESERARAVRIRQYEDFFNASGMATPDDLTEFKNCQIGYARGSGRYSDLSRGSTRWIRGGGASDVDAILSGPDIADEGLYVALHEEWGDRMRSAVAQERT